MCVYIKHIGNRLVIDNYSVDFDSHGDDDNSSYHDDNNNSNKIIKIIPVIIGETGKISK